jgi:hypothetical protein
VSGPTPEYGQQPEYGGQPPYGQQPQYGQQPGSGGQYPPPGGYDGGYGQPPVSPKNGVGIAALILGILSILAFWTFGFGIFLGIIAVVLGVLGRGRVKRREATNGGVATTGLVLGVLGIIGGAVFIALTVWVFNEVGVGDLATCLSDAGGDATRVEQCQQQFTDNLENQFSVTLTPAPTP